MQEFVSSANLALGMYPGLTQGAIAALLVHGSDEQKQTYLPKMIAGDWTGTMNLTEPHCGTDLGLLKTKADAERRRLLCASPAPRSSSRPASTTSPRTSSTSCSPASRARRQGTKGISLFVVPKFLVNDDGSLGERNGVACGSIEQKMGIHGNSTCVMNYDGAKGWLVGEENKGLAAMFVMMNEARLGVGMQGLAHREVAYQNAVAYAKDRLQGRALTGAEGSRQAGRSDHRPPGRAPHADVDQGLQRGGARARRCGARCKVDIAHRSADEAERAGRRRPTSGLMTPVIKGVLTDWASTTRSRRSRCSAATAISRNRACRSSSAMPASP